MIRLITEVTTAFSRMVTALFIVVLGSVTQQSAAQSRPDQSEEEMRRHQENRIFEQERKRWLFAPGYATAPEAHNNEEPNFSIIFHGEFSQLVGQLAASAAPSENLSYVAPTDAMLASARRSRPLIVHLDGHRLSFESLLREVGYRLGAVEPGSGINWVLEYSASARLLRLQWVERNPNGDIKFVPLAP